MSKKGMKKNIKTDAFECLVFRISVSPFTAKHCHALIRCLPYNVLPAHFHCWLMDQRRIKTLFPIEMSHTDKHTKGITNHQAFSFMLLGD